MNGLYVDNDGNLRTKSSVEFKIPENDDDFCYPSRFFGFELVIRGLYGEKLNMYNLLGFMDQDKLCKYLISISNLDCIDYVTDLYSSLSLYGNILPRITLKTFVNITKFSSPAQKLHRENNRKRLDVGFVKLRPNVSNFNQNQLYDVRIKTLY